MSDYTHLNKDPHHVQVDLMNWCLCKQFNYDDVSFQMEPVQSNTVETLLTLQGHCESGGRLVSRCTATVRGYSNVLTFQYHRLIINQRFPHLRVPVSQDISDTDFLSKLRMLHQLYFEPSDVEIIRYQQPDADGHHRWLLKVRPDHLVWFGEFSVIIDEMSDTISDLEHTHLHGLNPMRCTDPLHDIDRILETA